MSYLPKTKVGVGVSTVFLFVILWELRTAVLMFIDVNISSVNQVIFVIAIVLLYVIVSSFKLYQPDSSSDD